MTEPHPQVTPEARAEAWEYLLERTAPNPRSGCWEWGLSLNQRGYGAMRRRGSHWLAHRFAYHHLVEYLPRSTIVHHRCTNRACVNPEHLQAVSHLDNVAEMLGRRQLLEEIRALQDHIDKLTTFIDEEHNR